MHPKSLPLIWASTLLLAACNVAPTSPATPAAPTSKAAEQPASAATEKVRLRLWSHNNPAFVKVNQSLVDAFMKANPNIEVKYEQFPYDQLIQTLQTSMPAKSEADVIEMFGTWTCGYARGGRLMEVPRIVMSLPEAQEQFFKAPLDGYNCDGKLYGFPNEFNLEYGGVLVNPEIFKKHNVPYPPQWKSFDELIADAKKMTESDSSGAMTVAGYNYIGGDSLGFAFLAGILQQGGNYFAEDGKHFNFLSPEAMKAAQLLVDMAQRDKVVDPVLFTDDKAIENFFQGKTAILFRGPWAAASGLVDFPGFKFDYVNVPPYFGNKHVFAADSGWGKVVSINTKHPEEAWKLAQFMAANRDNAQTWNGATGTVPALKSIVAKPDEFLKQAPWVKPTFEILPGGVFIGNVGDRDQLWYQIMSKHLLDAIQGTTPLDEAMKAIQTEANAMIDKQK